MTNFALPTTWADAEQLDGQEIVDKATLVGIPFIINAVTFDTNARGISYVYVDGATAEGEQFTFNDSSSGVRAQLLAYLSSKGKDTVVDSGEVVEIALVIPKGLRVSEFQVNDERGKAKTARTYYLTVSGKRAAKPATKPVGKSTSKPAAAAK